MKFPYWNRRENLALKMITEFISVTYDSEIVPLLLLYIYQVPELSTGPGVYINVVSFGQTHVAILQRNPPKSSQIIIKSNGINVPIYPGRPSTKFNDTTIGPL